jgi:hypothetical protein
MSYDQWLEAPYQRNQGDVPPTFENYADCRVWIEDEDEFAQVTSYECWEDADEDGRHGGTDLILTLPSGRTLTLSESEIEEVWPVSEQINYWTGRLACPSR